VSYRPIWRTAERIDTTLQFARIQAQFIFDDIAQAERVKMDVATTNLSGGINIGAADATAPDVLGDAQRERISAATDAASAAASARKDWQTVGRGGRTLKRTETIRPHASPATQHKHPNQLGKDAQGNPVPKHATHNAMDIVPVLLLLRSAAT
jgi:hypothetical protein